MTYSDVLITLKIYRCKPLDHLISLVKYIFFQSDCHFFVVLRRVKYDLITLITYYSMYSMLYVSSPLTPGGITAKKRGLYK